MKKIAISISSLIILSFIFPSVVLAQTDLNIIAINRLIHIGNNGVLSFFFLMMAVGFAGFYGYKKQINN